MPDRVRHDVRGDLPRLRRGPSTMLRMVPLPVPGRIYSTRTRGTAWGGLNSLVIAQTWRRLGPENFRGRGSRRRWRPQSWSSRSGKWPARRARPASKWRAMGSARAGLGLGGDDELDSMERDCLELLEENLGRLAGG